MKLVLREHADAALSYRIAANGRQELPLHGIVQVQPDIVIAVLHADFGFHRQARELALKGVRCVDATEDTVVVLMKLIAIDGVGEKVREVVPEVERTLDDIKIGLRGAAFVSFRPATRLREAISISAVSGIERAIKANLAGSDGPGWNLIGGIPMVGIGHSG